MTRCLKIAAIVVIAVITTVRAGVEERYDKFSKSRTFRTDFRQIELSRPGEMYVIGMALYSNNALVDHPPDALDLVAFSQSSDWIYLKDQQQLKMIVLADDARITLPINHFDSDVEVKNGATCKETMVFTLKPKDLIAITTAKKVECKIGATVFSMPKDFINDLAELSYKTMIASPPPPPPVEIPFNETEQFRTLNDAVVAAQKGVDDAKAESRSAVERGDDYKKALAAVEKADGEKQRATGQARFKAANEWIQAKGKLDAIKKKSTNDDPIVVDAQSKLDGAKNNLAAAESEYKKHPATRPADK